MKHQITGKLFLKCSLVLLLGISTISLYGQTKHRAYLKLNYLKDSENNKNLIAELKTKIDKKFRLVENATINFYKVSDSTKLLGSLKTDKKGIANFVLKNNNENDTLGAVNTYMAEFEGCDTLKSKESEVEFKDLVLKMELKVIDSVKTLIASATTFEDGEEKALSEIEISFFVQRLYSLLPIAEAEFDEGECSIEFPDDLPGDPESNVIIYAKIIDSDEYGNVEQSAKIDWGLPVTLVQDTYNPFMAGKYLTFIFISVLLTILIVFGVNKFIKKN